MRASPQLVSDAARVESNPAHPLAPSPLVVFPEFKLIVDIEISKDGAKELYESALNPNLGRSGAPSPSLKSWLLPYKAVILLCERAVPSSTQNSLPD